MWPLSAPCLPLSQGVCFTSGLQDLGDNNLSNCDFSDNVNTVIVFKQLSETKIGRCISSYYVCIRGYYWYVMLKLKQPCMLTIVGGGLRRLNVQYVGFEGHGGLSGLEVCGVLYCIPSYNLNFPALASQQQFRSSSAEWIYSEKHLNLKLMPYIWLCFVIIWDWFKISPDPTQQEPLHLPRGFVCAQSPVSRRVEFAIKWVGKLFLFPPKELCFFYLNDFLLFIIPLLSHSSICSLEVKSCEEIDYKWEIIAEEWEGETFVKFLRLSGIERFVESTQAWRLNHSAKWIWQCCRLSGANAALFETSHLKQLFLTNTHIFF